MGVDWRNPGGTIPWLLGRRAGVRESGQESEGCCTVLPWVPAKLMWARDLECAGVVLEGWQECLYHVPVCAVKVWGTKNALWCL